MAMYYGAQKFANFALLEIFVVLGTLKLYQALEKLVVKTSNSPLFLCFSKATY